MLDKETSGLWCRSDNTWYYLESGPHIKSNSIDKVKNVLISRGKITYSIGGPRLHEEPYLVMNLAEAKNKGYEIVPVFLNKHVQKVFEAEVETKATKSPWI